MPKGKLVSPAYVTAFRNGVLIQNHVQLTGPTSWLERAPYDAHPVKQPIALQDHGNPVRFRNIWVRELGQPGRKEFTFAAKVLDGYTGTYEVRPDFDIDVTREGNQLVAKFGGTSFVLFAESPTHFFAKTTDVQIDFNLNDQGRATGLVLSVGEGGMPAKKIK